MPQTGTVKKALQWGAFFIFMLLLATATAAVQSGCNTPRIDESVQISKVYDGDTVRLTDGRKLRLIGINSPELGKERQPAEPYAEAAHQALMDIAKRSARWQVRWGTQKKDRYGRWLGHVFVGSNNINGYMIQQGLAAVITVPPNLWAQDCYQELEKEARSARLGLWSENGYVIRRAEALPVGLKGFQIIKGRVQKIVRTPKSIWLELSDRFSIRIAKKDFEYFDNQQIEHLRDHEVEVRGWLNYHRGRSHIRVRYPAAIQTSQY